MTLPRGRLLLAAATGVLVALGCGSSAQNAAHDAATPDAAHTTTTAHVDSGAPHAHDAHVAAHPDAGQGVPDAPAIDARTPDATADAATTRDAAGDATGHDATAHDATAHDASSRDVISPHDASVRDSGSADSPFGFLDVFIVGDVVTIGPPMRDGNAQTDVYNDAPRLNACGICDRVWVCNGFTDSFVSTSADSCAYIRGGATLATLYCEDGNDTLNYPSPNEAGDSETDGTWKQTSTGLALSFEGAPSVIDCVPPS